MTLNAVFGLKLNLSNLTMEGQSLSLNQHLQDLQWSQEDVSFLRCSKSLVELEPVIQYLIQSGLNQVIWIDSNSQTEMVLPSRIATDNQWLKLLAEQSDLDFCFQSSEMRFRQPKLMVFDMDSTLIQMECIDELARRCGFYPEVAAITEQAMRGELDFSQSLRKRVSLLNGLSICEIEAMLKDLPLSKGVDEFSKWAKKQGIILAVVSGGFVPFVESIKTRLSFDYAFANTLEQASGKLTGKVLGEIVDGERKKQILIELANKHQLEMEDVWAIGDGANDIPMMTTAGFGVAFDAKPKVRAAAKAAIAQPDMSVLLKWLLP